MTNINLLVHSFTEEGILLKIENENPISNNRHTWAKYFESLST